MKQTFLFFILFLIIYCCNTYADDSLFDNGISEEFPEPPGISERAIKFEPDPDDLDNDGLKNPDEERYGTDPYDPDTDNDGFLDLMEITYGTDPNNKNTTGYLEVIDLETKKKDVKSTEDIININDQSGKIDDIENVPPVPGAENDLPPFPWDDETYQPKVIDDKELENTDEVTDIFPPVLDNEEDLSLSGDKENDSISKESLNDLTDEENNQQALLDSPSSGFDLTPIFMLLLLNDNDNDGLDDDWEILHFGDLISYDADDDPDQDNLSNLGKYNNHTDPNNPDSDSDGLTDGWEVVNGLNPTSNDSDEDLMPDNWEVVNGLNPIIFDAYDNLDNDGFTNYQEYVIETDPDNAADTPSAPDYIDLGFEYDEQQGGGGIVGETIHILNGNVIEYRTDLNFSSPNQLGLSLEAFYNSKSTNTGSMGYGWSHTYEVSLDDDFILGSLSLLKIIDSTGKSHYFYLESTGEYKGVFAEKSYVKIESNNYIWHLLDGTQYGFSSEGRLLWIDDPSSNRLSLTYDINNKLTTVTDNVSGRELSFYYDVNGYLDYVAGPITTAVTDGKWVDYTITSQNLTSVTYKDNSGFNYTYTDTNDIHNLTGKTNKAGHLINNWGYDTSDRATSNYSRDGKGVNLITYQTSTQVNVTDAYSKIRTYYLTTKATRKRIETITESGGRPIPFPWSSDNTVNWVYDNNMNPVETESAGGTVTQYSGLDERGNPGTVTLASEEPEERIITFTYHPYLNTPLTRIEASVLGQPGGSKETIWDYDNDYDSEPNENPTANVSRVIEKGYTRNVSGTVVPYEYITTITYNTKGQVLTIDGPLSGTADTTSIFYNTTTGDIQTITKPIIGATSFTNYDNAGQVRTITDVNSQSKTYTYDARGRVTTTTNNADSSVSSVIYNTAGLPDSQADEDEVDSTFEYEATYGRLFKRFDHEGNYIKYEYDSQGNVTEKGYYDPTDVRTNRQRYLYQDVAHNMPGLLFKEINGDDTYTQYGYDLEGNVTSVINPNGNTTGYTYDPLNRVKTVTQPGSRVTTYSYDSHGNLSSVTDAELNATTYQYDDMGRLVSTTSPDTGTVTYVYDGAGNPVNKTDAKGITIVYEYDILNRLTNVNFPNTTQNITYSYDQGTNGKGQRTGMTDESGSTTFTYNTRGRLTGKTNTVQGITYNLSRIYTPGGRVGSVTYPTGRTIDYHRSSCMCSVDSITTTYNSITKILMGNLEYRPFGGAKGMSTGGGGTVGSTFNDAGRMTVSNPGATHEKTYTYDNNGNLTSITAPSLPYHSRVFGYDAIDRLTHAEGSWGNIDYTYDDVGNRLTQVTGTNTETYNYLTGTNRLNTITGGTAKTYAYDSNGNITGINTRVLTYNQDNRLTKVQEGSNILGEYTYNGLGQRIKKVAGATTTIFHYDFDGNIIGESNLTGTFAKEYLYRSSNRLAMVNVSNGEIYFFGNDSLGTPQILTNSNNTVVWEATYKPFGEAAVNQGSTVENNFRFQGQYYDAETGFHYNLHRYYDPTTGRYLSPDPIGLAGGLNLFIYVGGNPVNNTDPKGLEFLLMGKGDLYLLGKEPYFFRPRSLRGPNPRYVPRNIPKETPNPTPRPVNELPPDPIKPTKLGQFLKDLADFLDEAGLGGLTDFFNKPESALNNDDPCENDPEPKKSNSDKEWWDECYRLGLCA